MPCFAWYPNPDVKQHFLSFCRPVKYLLELEDCNLDAFQLIDLKIKNWFILITLFTQSKRSIFIPRLNTPI